MLNIQDFIDAGACARDVCNIVKATGRISASTDELLYISSKWTKLCLSGHTGYGDCACHWQGHWQGHNGYGCGDGYVYGDGDGDGDGDGSYGCVNGYGRGDSDGRYYGCSYKYGSNGIGYFGYGGDGGNNE